MKLNNTACKNYKPKEKAYRMTDGGGLYLEIMPNGSKYWRMNYRFMGKQKTLALGVYDRVSLAEAREKRQEAKKMLDQGIDPSAKKKEDKLQLHIEHENSFEVIAREWHSERSRGIDDKYSSVIISRLEKYLLPYLGGRPIKSITSQELITVIRKVEQAGHYDSAKRLLQYSAQIYRYAVRTGRAEKDITYDLKGAIQPAKHTVRAYLDEKQLPDFLEKLDRYDKDFNGSLLTKLAFKFLILTFVRSKEIRGAKWDEIDWDKSLWRIPAERMKMNETHIVPLAHQSITLLKQIHDITGDNPSGFIFPSQQSLRKIMSENTFLRAIEILGYKGKATGHGFRSTASTILHENGFESDWIERQLAHAKRNQVRAAYDHAKYLKQRISMMQWWADYIYGESEGSNKVIAADFRKR